MRSSLVFALLALVPSVSALEAAFVCFGPPPREHLNVPIFIGDVRVADVKMERCGFCDCVCLERNATEPSTCPYKRVPGKGRSVDIKGKMIVVQGKPICRYDLIRCDSIPMWRWCERYLEHCCLTKIGVSDICGGLKNIPFRLPFFNPRVVSQIQLPVFCHDVAPENTEAIANQMEQDLLLQLDLRTQIEAKQAEYTRLAYGGRVNVGAMLQVNNQLMRLRNSLDELNAALSVAFCPDNDVAYAAFRAWASTVVHDIVCEQKPHWRACQPFGAMAPEHSDSLDDELHFRQHFDRTGQGGGAVRVPFIGTSIFGDAVNFELVLRLPQCDLLGPFRPKRFATPGLFYDPKESRQTTMERLWDEEPGLLGERHIELGLPIFPDFEQYPVNIRPNETNSSNASNASDSTQD